MKTIEEAAKEYAEEKVKDLPTSFFHGLEGSYDFRSILEEAFNAGAEQMSDKLISRWVDDNQD